jgi:hypothetical protein
LIVKELKVNWSPDQGETARWMGGVEIIPPYNQMEEAIIAFSSSIDCPTLPFRVLLISTIYCREHS